MTLLALGFTAPKDGCTDDDNADSSATTTGAQATLSVLSLALTKPAPTLREMGRVLTEAPGVRATLPKTTATRRMCPTADQLLRFSTL
jgi:hypothetical protein